MTISDEYKIFSSKKEVVRRYPKAFVPEPTAEDYQRGWIVRYFAKLKTNKNSPIVEIDADEYNRFRRLQEYTTQSRLFLLSSLRWRIKGTLEEVQVSNSKSVSRELLMPDLRYKLSNLLQFWKK